MAENDPANIPLPQNGNRNENRTGGNERTARDKDDPVEDKPIKIYSFSINKLNEENTRYWFHAIEKQLRGQYAWQAIKLHAQIGNTEYINRLASRPKWHRIDMQADMIIEMGLDSTTTLEVKDQQNAGEKWEYLKKKFLKSSSM